MLVRFGSVRHIFRLRAGRGSGGSLSGGISEWDSRRQSLASWPVTDLGSTAPDGAGTRFAAAALAAAADTADPAWDSVLASLPQTLDRGAAYDVVLTCGRSLTESEGDIHVQSFARVRAVAHRADGTPVWKATTLPDPAPTPASRSAVTRVTAWLADCLRDGWLAPSERRHPVAGPTASTIPLLLRGDAACYLVHEMLGHVLEHSHHNERRLRRLGRLSPLLTVWDEPNSPSYVRYARDTEDVLARNTLLVDAGGVLTSLCDRTSATAAGQEPTGNGRRQDYCFPPRTRMTALRLEPGPDGHADLLEQVTNGGLVVQTITEGRMFAVRGVVVLHANRAAYFPGSGGSVPTGPVRLAFDIDNALTHGLLGLGDRSTTSIHSCRKDRQEINVAVRSPDILLTCDKVSPLD